jgi:hypothetical protein
MQSALIENFEAQRSIIYARWKDLLSLDRKASPLASPEILVYMVDSTIDELLNVFREMKDQPPQEPPAAVACPCGRNPYLPYFASGRQAMREALVLAQAAIPFLDPTERDHALRELEAAYGQIERRHI